MEGSNSKCATLPLSLSFSQREQNPLIGYYLSRKKLSKLHFEQFLLICKHFHIDTIELTSQYFQRTNVRIPQLIIHKLEDDLSSRSLIETIRSLPKSSTILLDPFDSIARLSDRYEQYSLLKTRNKSFLVPPFIRVSKDENKLTIETMLIKNQISFPIVCKPIQAHGEKSHHMKIIFDIEHLNDIDKPCVLQQFIDHNGILFKIFASKLRKNIPWICSWMV